MQNQINPELYELYDKDTGKFLGICELDSHIPSIGTDEENTELKLTINLKFSYLDDLQVKSKDSQFLACYINNATTGEHRASISSHSPFNIGAIEISPERINGQRVGGLIIYKVIQWLKRFPETTQINPIKFKPAGNTSIAKRFYANIGAPINGDPFTIGDLKLHDAWVQNIKPIQLNKLQTKLSDLNLEKTHLEIQSTNLKKQIHQLSDIKFTTNFLTALKTYYIQPNLITNINSSPITKNQSKENTIIDYLTTQEEVFELKENVERYIQIIKEFNDYKQPKNKWRNLRDAIKFFCKVHQKQCIIILMGLIITLSFLAAIMENPT